MSTYLQLRTCFCYSSVSIFVWFFYYFCLSISRKQTIIITYFIPMSKSDHRSGKNPITIQRKSSAEPALKCCEGDSSHGHKHMGAQKFTHLVGFFNILWRFWDCPTIFETFWLWKFKKICLRRYSTSHILYLPVI